MLSDLVVRRAPARDKRYAIHDGGGLYLRVHPTGTKTWLLRSRAGGDSWITLGHYPALSLKGAREKAEALTTGSTNKTVAQAWADYLPLLRTNYRKPGIIEARFENDALPYLKDKYVPMVAKADVIGVLDTILKRGKRVQANRMLPDLRNFFEYCVNHAHCTTNPVEGITRKYVGGKEKHRDRVLTRDELERLIGLLLTPRHSLQTRLALALALLTGQRSSEVLGIDRREISGVWWVIPKGRMKMRRQQCVYLTPATRLVLRTAFSTFGAKPFTTGRCVLSRAMTRMKFVPKATPHDFRHTMSTRMAELGVAPHIKELCLAHKLTGVMGVYDHAEYLPERRAAWRLWAAYLTKIRRGRKLQN